MANRIVYLAAMVRDPSLASVLARLLDHRDVQSECIYACSVVFALSLHGAFDGWTPPRSLDPSRAVVSDLQAVIARLGVLSLEKRPIEDFTSGPGVDWIRVEIVGKTEEQLISLAGPATPSFDVRSLAAVALQASVATSTNRVELYLLTMHNQANDASREYLHAVHEAIYRAEVARHRGR